MLDFSTHFSAQNKLQVSRFTLPGALQRPQTYVRAPGMANRASELARCTGLLLSALRPLGHFGLRSMGLDQDRGREAEARMRLSGTTRICRVAFRGLRVLRGWRSPLVGTSGRGRTRASRRQPEPGAKGGHGRRLCGARPRGSARTAAPQPRARPRLGQGPWPGTCASLTAAPLGAPAEAARGFKLVTKRRKPEKLPFGSRRAET